MEYIGEELATHSWTNLEDRMQFELDGVVEKEIKTGVQCGKFGIVYVMYGLYYAKSYRYR